MLFSGKIRFHDVARLTARCVLFATICHYSQLFTTIRDYSLFATIRYSGFSDTQIVLYRIIHLFNVLSASSIQRVPSMRNWVFYLRCWRGNCFLVELTNQLIPYLFSHFSALLRLDNFCHWIIKFWEQLKHCNFFMQTNLICSLLSQWSTCVHLTQETELT